MASHTTARVLCARRYPVLMYHKVGYPAACQDENYLNVSSRSFRRQMQILYRLGYRTRPLAEIAKALQAGYKLPPRTFAITFDDGYRCVWESALPILQELNFTATMFVVSGCVGSANLWDLDTIHPQAELMDWHEVRQLHAAGWEIGGHTCSHPRLTLMDAQAAFEEISRNKTHLETQLKCAIHTFCYPYGDTNRQVADLARKAGYTAACTIRSGLASTRHNPLLLPRVKVYHEGILDLLYRVLLRPYMPTFRRSTRAPVGAAAPVSPFAPL